MQNTRHIAMVRPAAFGFNEETASNNYFQDIAQKNNDALQQSALEQFDSMVTLLRQNDIDVLVLQDETPPAKPDAVFPNNWFCCNNNMIQVFPMQAANRRLEKNWQFIDAIKEKTGIPIVKDWGSYEEKEMYLEGTGSMIIDHNNNMAYACISLRTNEDLFIQFCKENNYTPIAFNASDDEQRPIYHTNVMMCVGERFAVICLDAIPDEIDRKKLVHELQTTGHEIIPISLDQMKNFAGNMLEVLDNNDGHILVMSKTAHDILTPDQLSRLTKYARIISPDVHLIERAAGGSVRCMMAELFY